MDVFERFNTKFGKWYEGLFGGDTGELRPKDVLRKITAAMEDNRKEGFDNKIYVPNKYVLELAVEDPEERDYLLSFLDEEELVSVLQRFMAQNHYHARGPLDFTIAEVPAAERDAHREKLRVKVRFEKGEIAPPPASSATPPPSERERGQGQNSSLASPPAIAAMSGSHWPLSLSEGGGVADEAGGGARIFPRSQACILTTSREPFPQWPGPHWPSPAAMGERAISA